MKLYKRIRIVYLLAAVIITILIVLGLLYLQKRTAQIKLIYASEHSFRVLSTINNFEKNLIGAEAAQRGYLLTSDVHFKDEFQSVLHLTDSSLDALARVTKDDNVQKIYLFQLQKFVGIHIKLLKQNLDVKSPLAGNNEALRQEMIAMEHCKNYLNKMRASEEASLNSILVRKNKYQQVNLFFFLAIFITACLISILVIGVFFRELGIRLATQLRLRRKIDELTKSRKELEQVTFAASHDLQEPMRKIRILSSMLAQKMDNKIVDADMDIIQRINKVAEKMQSQLSDLVLYTNLLAPTEHLEAIDLNDLFKNVYDALLKDESADLKIVNQLPAIKGSMSQLKVMVTNLLDNAKKYQDKNRILTITVGYKIINIRESKLLWDYRSVKHYHQITVTDNGIGFDPQYNEKIFGLFQRLHNQSEYPGKGIGLSIARQVMSNHQGFIYAAGEKMTGASFILQFPG